MIRKIVGKNFGSTTLTLMQHPLADDVVLDWCRWVGASPAIEIYGCEQPGRILFTALPHYSISNCYFAAERQGAQ